MKPTLTIVKSGFLCCYLDVSNWMSVYKDSLLFKIMYICVPFIIYNIDHNLCNFA